MPELPSSRPVAAKSDSLTPKFMAAVIAGVLVTGLYFGRPVLLPLALAVLISFALAPLVALLKRLSLGNVLPVLVSVLFAVVITATMNFGVTVSGLAATVRGEGSSGISVSGRQYNHRKPVWLQSNFLKKQEGAPVWQAGPIWSTLSSRTSPSQSTKASTRR